MHIVEIILFCFIFTSLVITLVYFVSFRKPSQMAPRNKPTDVAFLAIKDDRHASNRNTNYLIFYNLNTENDYSLNTRFNRVFSSEQFSAQKDFQGIKLACSIGLILLFSFTITLAVKSGVWLFQIYSWLH